MLRFPFRRLRLLGLLLLGFIAAVPFVRAANESGSDLRLVILVTRHGVRSPIYSNKQLGAYAAEPWPTWSVPEGFLTPHGHQQMVLMGAYYRTRYIAEGLLTGDAAKDRAQVYFRSDSDQRTIQTAHNLAEGLLPGEKIDPHSRPLDELDPLFRAAKLPIGHPNYALAVANVEGRIGQDLGVITTACAPEFATLHRVLFGADGRMAPDKQDVRSLPAAVERGTGDHTVTIKGPLRTAMQLTDNLILEYTEGMPMSQVGWGRLSAADLTQLIRLHALYFDLAQGTFYPAQVQASDLASHILSTLQQAATGRAQAGAFGSTTDKVVVLVGHDTNIVNLGGLLGLSWWLPGTQPNPVLPGGALVFELRQRHSDHGFVVRTYYVSQTLDQTRNLDPLTLDHPPAVAPIFIPGCSGTAPGFEAPLAGFDALLRRVIDPEFVLADPN